MLLATRLTLSILSAVQVLLRRTRPEPTVEEEDLGGAQGQPSSSRCALQGQFLSVRSFTMVASDGCKGNNADTAACRRYSGRLVQYSFSGFTTKKDEESVVKFFEDKDTKDYQQPLLQGLDAVRARTAWLKRDADDVSGWLKENGGCKSRL